MEDKNSDERPPLVDEWDDDSGLAERYRKAGYEVESGGPGIDPAGGQHDWYIAYGHGGKLPERKSTCFIATTVYGDINAPEVQVLRDFRDNVLMETGLGKRAVDLYYGGFGERVAEFIKTNISSSIPWIRKGLDYVVCRYQKKDK